MKTKKKVIAFAGAQFWDMKMLGGMLPDYLGDTSLHGFAPMVMKRFEIIEKLYLSKALLKMAGGGDASPTSPPLDPPCSLLHYRYITVFLYEQVSALCLHQHNIY